MIMLKYIIAKKYNKYLKYNTKCRKLKPKLKPKQYQFLIVYLFIN